MVCTRFTLVNTLVLTVELHGKRMVMYYYFYHGIIHFALQLLHGKPPLLFVVWCHALSSFTQHGPTHHLAQRHSDMLCAYQTCSQGLQG